MEDNEQEYDDFYYDDGRFADSDEEQRCDESDIPTYDELDLEGRYYEYGSREEYNAWRNRMIYGQNNDYFDKNEDIKANIITFIIIVLVILWCIF